MSRFHGLKLAFMVRQRMFPARALNFASFLRQRGRAATVSYFPPVLGLETCGFCNLRCPGCSTGLRVPRGDRKRLTGEDVGRAVIDGGYQRALQISLYRQGEPLLNPAFFSLCAHAARRGLWTVTHSNLSLEVSSLGRRICEAGLNNLVVSCDGATQETYAKYRQGGDLELVFENIRRIVRAKRRRGATFPWITIKFLVFDHNWHEIEDFQAMAAATGADEVLYISGLCSSIYRGGKAAVDAEFDLETLEWKHRSLGTSCHFIWDMMEMDYDGAVFPCCWAHSDEHLFTSSQEAGETDLAERWNSHAYRSARAFFLDEAERSELPSLCANCGIVEAKLQSRRARGQRRRER